MTLIRKIAVVGMLGAVALSANNASASRARNSVMFGNAGAGSFYYDDAYNMFYNPSYVNDYKNWAIIEKGNKDLATEAAGGFITSISGVNVGLYLNRDGVTNSNVTYGTGATRPLELFVGGDHGMKWGAGVSYVAGSKQSDIGLSVGAQVANFEPFAKIRAAAKNELNDAAKSTASDLTVGTRYKWGEWVPYAQFATNSSKLNGTAVDAAKTTDLTFGLGRNTKLTDSVTMNYTVSYTSNKVGTADATSSIPLVLSLEGDVTSWLTLRSGFRYFMSKSGANNTTVARIGGSFHIGKLDWNFALGGAAGATDSPEVGIGEKMLAQSSLSFRW